jgi:hypothetical protein
VHFDPAFDPNGTEFLSRMVKGWGKFEGVLTSSNSHYRYGYIALADRRMMPIIRPGSIVLVDTCVRQVDETHWTTEYDRPMYFVEIRDGYRCGWFHKDGTRLVMQAHHLSRCLQESWSLPQEAEVVGRVVGMVTRRNEPSSIPPRVSPTMREYSSRRAP